MNIVSALYKFSLIESPNILQSKIRRKLKSLSILGTILVGKEGLNGTISGKKENIDYGKIGTGKSGLGTINSEVDNPFNFEKGSVALARTQKYNTEDSQFFIVLRDEPLYETEYTPIGKVIYGLAALTKIKSADKTEYVLRPDFLINFKLLKQYN